MLFGITCKQAHTLYCAVSLPFGGLIALGNVLVGSAVMFSCPADFCSSEYVGFRHVELCRVFDPLG